MPEFIFSGELSKVYSFNINLNAYHNKIDSFTVFNKYPVPNIFSADKQEIFSGNIKLINTFHLPKKTEAQISAVFLAPDIIPQGKIQARFSLDAGIKKSIQKDKGELFFAATDLLNTMVIKKRITGDGFYYTSDDYFETQVIRIGYSYKF